MNDQEFNELVNGTRLSRASREAARLVFVEGRSQVEAGAEMNLSKSRMTQIVSVVRRAEQERQQQQPPSLGEGKGLLAVVEASYAFAVKAAREQLGDDVQIQSPRENAKTVGAVLARLDFHLVQSVGRNTVVVHELAKLDRVPGVGRHVAIQYQDGKGAVVDREQERQRGSRSR